MGPTEVWLRNLVSQALCASVLQSADGCNLFAAGVVIVGVAFNAIKFVIHGLWIQSDDLGGDPAPLTLMMHDCCANSTVTVETAAGIVDRFQKSRARQYQVLPVNLIRNVISAGQYYLTLFSTFASLALDISVIS